MADQVRPEEAARALTEIGQRQEQVIRLAVIPNWYWWAIAVLMVAFAAAVDTRQGLVVGIGTAVFVAGVLTTTGWVVFRAVRSAQPRNDLLGPGGVVAILGFVAVTIEPSVIKPKFDELIHAPTRLSLVSLLAATEWADFQFLRDSAGLSDSALSKQLTTLEDAGYIEIRKGFVGKRPRTSARLTSSDSTS